MFAVLLLALLLITALALWLGPDSSAAHSDKARPAAGWFPTLRSH